MSDSQPIRVLPRDLLGAWSVWLLAGWAMNLWINGGSPLPTMRHTLLGAAVGIGLVWPCWRLTLTCPAYPTLATFMDWLCGMILFQVLLVRIAVELSLDKAIIVDLTVAAHALVTAVIIDVGRRGGNRRRTLAMLAAVVIFLGPAIIGFTLPGAQAWAGMSMIRMIWLATDPTVFLPLQQVALPPAILAGVTAAVWIVAASLMSNPLSLPGRRSAVAGRGQG